MADVANKFGLGKSGGVHFSDPREFHRAAYLASKLNSFEAGAGAADLSSVAGFFTNIALSGVADDTNWTADTYKTILSISSGKGYVASMVGPTGLAGTPTTTFEITVDGVLYTVAVTATTTGHRAVLGAVGTTSAFFTTAVVPFIPPDSIEATKAVETVITQVGTMPTWQGMRLLGTPCLQFNTSLLIRMKSSESNSTTTNVERRSAVQYKVQA